MSFIIEYCFIEKSDILITLRDIQVCNISNEMVRSTCFLEYNCHKSHAHQILLIRLLLNVHLTHQIKSYRNRQMEKIVKEEGGQ